MPPQGTAVMMVEAEFSHGCPLGSSKILIERGGALASTRFYKCTTLFE